MANAVTVRRRRIPTAFCALAPLLPLALSLPSISEAQIVVGHLLESGTETPLEGALVLLLREGQEEEDGYLTNSAGRFQLRASGPGQFRLRAERIGFRTVTSAPFELTAGQVFGIDLETSSEPITLEGIDVEGQQKCVVRPEEGLALAQLWEEARKALRVQDWIEREGLYEYQVSDYERELGPDGRLIRAETRENQTRVARIPYRSLPVDELLTEGFIRRLENNSFDFFAPDAAVLLSDPFLDTHCFRLTTDPEAPRSIGLSFEPAESGGLSDIEGTLWLERESRDLQALQFAYTNLPYPRATAPAGGRVEFVRLPSGAWIVRRWWILMPTVSPNWTAWGPLRRVEYEVTSFNETGGEVREVFAAEKLVMRELPQGILAGVVWDSIRGQPLPGATVSLSGTPYQSVTDSTGRFSMTELPEGVYTAAVAHPMLDSLGVIPPGMRVEIAPDHLAEVELGIPSMETILAAICESAPQDSTFTLVGSVRLVGSGDPIPKVVVTAEWTRQGRTRFGEEATDRGFARLTTDGDGRYVFCDLPRKTGIKVSASFMDYAGDPQTVKGEVDSHVVVNLELELPPGTLVFRTSTEGFVPPREQQGIQGRVVDPISGRPIPNAEITIRWTQGEFSRSEIASAQGAFRVLSPWLGRFTLEARALGYKPVRSDSVVIEPGRLSMVEIEMPAEPIALDPVVVVSERRAFQLEVNGFYERAQQGFGSFITPEKIEARQAVELGDLLRDVPGLIVERTIVGTRVLFRKADVRGDFCNPRLYLDGVLIFQQSPFDEPNLAGTYLDLVAPLSDIAGIEVHTRATGIPLSYGGTQGSCGVILIWTKGG